MNEDLADIREVKECEKDEHANDYLSLGWILLNVHTYDFGHPVERHQKTIYSLGWPARKGSPVHPKGKYDHLINKSPASGQ